jgi:arylsulfatase A-like enzyme
MDPRPNILWILTTQWRAGAGGFAGDANARTPFLDQLAARSTWFAQAVTPHPFGPFARAALLTGIPSPENGVADYFDPLPVSARTIAHDLAECGYETAFFGKWHLGKRDQAARLVGPAHAKRVVPSDERGGFEFWEGFESGFLLNDPWLHGSRLEVPQKFSGYQSDVICDRAADYLTATSAVRVETIEGTRSPEPWFCVVSLEAPHPPYDAPAAGIVPTAPGELVLAGNVPRGDQIEATARRELSGYYAHIEATDRAIGRLLERTARDGARAPVVVFTSVHGDMHGAHGLFRKGWPYEESVRVPLLVSDPRGAHVGSKTEEAISLIDLPNLTRGWAEKKTSVRPGATHRKISMPSVVNLPQQCDRIWRGVRTKDRKLVLNSDGSPWLLFDLTEDPLEQCDRSGDPAWRDAMAELRRLV